MQKNIKSILISLLVFTKLFSFYLFLSVKLCLFSYYETNMVHKNLATIKYKQTTLANYREYCYMPSACVCDVFNNYNPIVLCLNNDTAYKRSSKSFGNK